MKTYDCRIPIFYSSYPKFEPRVNILKLSLIEKGDLICYLSSWYHQNSTAKSFPEEDFVGITEFENGVITNSIHLNRGDEIPEEFKFSNQKGIWFGRGDWYYGEFCLEGLWQPEDCEPPSYNEILELITYIKEN